MKTIKRIKKYISNKSFFQSHFKSQTPTINKIDDGKLNNIYKISLNEDIKPLIIKHYPSTKIIQDKTVKMPPNRDFFEYRALQRFWQNTPQYVPKVYDFDKDNNLVVMEYIKDSKNLKEVLIKEKKHIYYILSIIDFLITNIKANSLDFQENKDNLTKNFDNYHIKKYINDTLFTIHPDILKNNIKLQNNINYLKQRFNSEETLIHGNFQQSSIIAKNKSIFVLDYETCFLGIYQFDIGRLVSDFLIDYIYYSKIDKVYSTKALLFISQLLDKFQIKHGFSIKTFQEILGFAVLYIIQHANNLTLQEGPQRYITTLIIFSFEILNNLSFFNSVEDIFKTFKIIEEKNSIFEQKKIQSSKVDESNLFDYI